jgi:PKHD-type hydroxylase
MHILRQALTADELTAIRGALDHPEAVFESGKLTAGQGAAGVKHNLQLKREGPEATPLDQLVVAALSRHALFQAWAMPLRFAAPTFSRYEPGMAYGVHVDRAIMGVGNPIRSDVSVTVFLNAPEEYDGGELIVESPGGNRAVKLAAGDAFVYATTALHQVSPVTRGRRLVAVVWAQSLVRDEGMRQILFDMHAVCASLHDTQPESVEARLLSKAHSNLLRKLAET